MTTCPPYAPFFGFAGVASAVSRFPTFRASDVAERLRLSKMVFSSESTLDTFFVSNGTMALIIRNVALV